MSAPLPRSAATAAPTSHLIIAFAALYLIWGSTYLGMAIAIETMPPFLMAAARFVVAGGILFVVRRLLGDPWPSAQHWRSAAIVGSLLFVGGNGMVCWGQHWVPSGIAALLITTTPFWMIMLPWFAGRSPRPSVVVMSGISLGLIGVGVLVAAPVEKGHGNAASTTMLISGSLAIVGASLSWALGSLWSKSLPLPATLWMSSATQMLSGAAGLTLAALVSGEVTSLDLGAISLRSWLALTYLILVGAILGFGAYVYLLRHTTMARVSTYAFVNPVVAVLLGWLVLDEPLSGRTVIAGALIIVAVMLILRRSASAPR
ncbi:MAG TPA: EamA family transporter [Planctomycetota bacterium]|nr:EamA family transporter [Planctomycetota bacterium]